MPLTYADFEAATGVDVPAASDDRMPGHAEVSAIITDITMLSYGEFEELTGVTFSDTTARHRSLLWKLVRRRMLYYRRDKVGSTVSEQTAVGTITHGDTLGSSQQLNEDINILVNQINLFSSSMLVGGGYQ